ncbi:unnamed protein product [Mycena citricolor]|uniref:Uncharacterized protein n=1 Tax=Mycena citricolor TaxID=2018698 RepID=A0AAD2GXW0_9AGAR|nr:unnamed protein product [Mycena citricolor]
MKIRLVHNKSNRASLLLSLDRDLPMHHIQYENTAHARDPIASDTWDHLLVEENAQHPFTNTSLEMPPWMRWPKLLATRLNCSMNVLQVMESTCSSCNQSGINPSSTAQRRSLSLLNLWLLLNIHKKLIRISLAKFLSAVNLVKYLVLVTEIHVKQWYYAS